MKRSLLCLLLALSSSNAMAEETLLASKNFIATTTVNRVFNPPVPVVTPSSPAKPEAHKAELFRVTLTVPEHVSRVTIYPTYDENMGYGKLRKTTNSGEFIQYQMEDEKGNKMMKDEGIDVLANETVVFKAVNNRVDELPVSPGTYTDQLMVGYYVN
ncbi:TPA: Cro/Cl family transcriptional regulator [Salmonella enterica]|nr:Cro/Cl family transcriptional regulator [Salmonella enterica]